jgi:hypothetical protein
MDVDFVVLLPADGTPVRHSGAAESALLDHLNGRLLIAIAAQKWPFRFPAHP